MRKGWRQYFEMFPDYKVKITHSMESGPRVVFMGSTSATYAPNGMAVSMHAAWLAVVRGGRVAEWRVYADNEPARAAMRRGER